MKDGTDGNVKYDTHRGTMGQMGQRGGESSFDLKRAHPFGAKLIKKWSHSVIELKFHTKTNLRALNPKIMSRKNLKRAHLDPSIFGHGIMLRHGPGQ